MVGRNPGRELAYPRCGLASGSILQERQLHYAAVLNTGPRMETGCGHAAMQPLVSAGEILGSHRRPEGPRSQGSPKASKER